MDADVIKSARESFPLSRNMVEIPKVKINSDRSCPNVRIIKTPSPRRRKTQPTIKPLQLEKCGKLSDIRPASARGHVRPRDPLPRGSEINRNLRYIFYVKKDVQKISETVDDGIDPESLQELIDESERKAECKMLKLHFNNELTTIMPLICDHGHYKVALKHYTMSNTDSSIMTQIIYENCKANRTSIRIIKGIIKQHARESTSREYFRIDSLCSTICTLYFKDNLNNSLNSVKSQVLEIYGDSGEQINKSLDVIYSLVLPDNICFLLQERYLRVVMKYPNDALSLVNNLIVLRVLNPFLSAERAGKKKMSSDQMKFMVKLSKIVGNIAFGVKDNRNQEFHNIISHYIPIHEEWISKHLGLDHIYNNRN